MEVIMESIKKWKALAIVSTCLLLLMSFLYGQSILNKKQEENQTIVIPDEENISYLNQWNENAPAKLFLEEYMKDITDVNSKNFIPVENRIAVFDLDGTLFCETDPIYFDHMIFMHRVFDDPNHTPSEFEVEVAEQVQIFIDTGEYPEGLDNLHGQGVATAFKGMSVKEFYEYVEMFGQTPSPSYENMNRGDAFYIPMIEVIEFLQDNDFTVYVVSGTDRLIVRGVLQGIDFLHIAPNNIIGSDELLVAPNQGDTDGLDYVFTDDDDLILAGEFIIKNLKMNKVTAIFQEIGIQPVLAFGNSSGDASMGKYTVTNNPYRSQAFMLCCDDLERENGNTEKALKMKESCEKNGWIAISMKDDWNTIYGQEVKKK